MPFPSKGTRMLERERLATVSQSSDEGSSVGGSAAARQDSGEPTSGIGDQMSGNICRNSAKVTNRRHCRETRIRKAQRERVLEEEVEVLELLKAIVENGPDLFSLHTVDIDAKFSFACEDYQLRLQVRPDDILGRPLTSIVDPRDEHNLKFAVSQVLDQANADGSATSGAMVNLRVVWGDLSYRASMTISIGSEGLVVVTRLYDA